MVTGCFLHLFVTRDTSKLPKVLQNLVLPLVLLDIFTVLSLKYTQARSLNKPSCFPRPQKPRLPTPMKSNRSLGKGHGEAKLNFECLMASLALH